jgi:carnitine O-acetyltransferase
MLLSKQNAQTLDQIERAAFIVCLDDAKPVTKDEISRESWHGDGRNRFYDKALQFIIYDNGKAGFLGEHSMMDATPTNRICEFTLMGIVKGKFDLNVNAVTAQLHKPTQLSFETSSEIDKAIKTATSKFDTNISNVDLRVVSYEAYGKNLVKTFGVSPDAYAQMAIQLAYFKMYGVCRATYESAQTKKYRYGRTETCRSVSVESVAWVKAMQDPNLPVLNTIL